MSGRLAVLVGLLAGLVTAGIVFVVALQYAPQIADALYPTPAVPGVTAPPTLPPRPSASAAASPSANPSASPSATPGPSASGSTGPPPPSASASTAFRIGEEAPPIKLDLLGGGTVDLAKLRGMPVWVNFMATYCEPCIDEFPLMTAFQARYEDEGLIVLAVDVREEPALVQAFVDETGALFRVARDRDGVAQKAWGAIALPIHFWVDREGIIRDGALGGIGPDDMARGIQSIMPEIEVTPP